jgi:hypothetical protein
VALDDPACVSFMLEAGPQVKIGQDEIKNKMNILSNLIASVKKDLGNIAYIDLRFKEPVIKFKNVK